MKLSPELFLFIATLLVFVIVASYFLIQDISEVRRIAKEKELSKKPQAGFGSFKQLPEASS